MPTPTLENYQQIIETIKAHEKILVFTHAKPDGDAIGSLLAMGALIRALGKAVTLLCSDPIPAKFHFLEGVSEVRQSVETLDLLIHVPTLSTEVDKVSYNITDGALNLVITPVKGQFDQNQITMGVGKPSVDLIITLDTPELRLLGSLYTEHPSWFTDTEILVIDHHVSSERYGKINLVDDKAPSTGEVLFHLMDSTKQTLTPAMATALLCAVVTDTGSFQHASTTADSFTTASRLMETGGDLQRVVENMYRRKSVATLKLWGRILSNLKQDEARRLVWVAVSLDDFEETGAPEEEASEALNELIVGIPSTDVAVMLYAFPGQPLRGSIRTSPRFNASELAALFGGGGHPPAAGFPLGNQPLEVAEADVIARFKAAIDQNQARREPATPAYTPEQVVEKIGALMGESSSE